MYAIVKVGGKQYRVEKGDSIVVDRLHEDEGAKVALDPLLYADGAKAVFEGADLEKVKVEAVVKGHERGPKIRVLKFKPKKGYKRRTGHRSELTRLEIGDIKLLQRRSPAVKETKVAEEQTGATPKKPPAKKPGAARRSASGTASGAPKAAKKPATRKTSTTRKTQEKDDGS
jgi:large subunit ribosomal protein L21